MSSVFQNIWGGIKNIIRDTLRDSYYITDKSGNSEYLNGVETSDRDIYVESTSGSDITGNGTFDKPFKTLKKARENILKYIKQNTTITINLAESGTYQVNDFITEFNKLKSQGIIRITSTPTARYTTPLDSGTFSNNEKYKKTDSSKSWTPGEYRGKILYDVVGGRYFMIANNSATELFIQGNSTFANINITTYEILDYAIEIENNIVQTDSIGQVIIEFIKFSSPNFYQQRNVGDGNFLFSNCIFSAPFANSKNTRFANSYIRLSSNSANSYIGSAIFCAIDNTSSLICDNYIYETCFTGGTSQNSNSAMTGNPYTGLINNSVTLGFSYIHNFKYVIGRNSSLGYWTNYISIAQLDYNNVDFCVFGHPGLIINIDPVFGGSVAGLNLNNLNIGALTINGSAKETKYIQEDISLFAAAFDPNYGYFGKSVDHLDNTREWILDSNSDVNQDGNFRIRLVGTALLIERRESGTWTEKGRYENSFRSDRFFIRDLNPVIVAENPSVDRRWPMLRATPNLGVEVGNYNSQVFLSSNENLIHSRKTGSYQEDVELSIADNVTTNELIFQLPETTTAGKAEKLIINSSGASNAQLIVRVVGVPNLEEIRIPRNSEYNEGRGLSWNSGEQTITIYDPNSTLAEVKSWDPISFGPGLIFEYKIKSNNPITYYGNSNFQGTGQFIPRLSFLGSSFRFDDILTNQNIVAGKNIKIDYDTETRLTTFSEDSPCGGGYFSSDINILCTLLNIDYKINANFIEWPIQNKFEYDSTNKRWIYTDGETCVITLFNFSLKATQNNSVVTIKIFKNGVFINGFKFKIEIINANKVEGFGSIIGQDLFKQNDYIEIFVSSSVSNNTITVSESSQLTFNK